MNLDHSYCTSSSNGEEVASTSRRQMVSCAFTKELNSWCVNEIVFLTLSDLWRFSAVSSNTCSGTKRTHDDHDRWSNIINAGKDHLSIFHLENHPYFSIEHWIFTDIPNTTAKKMLSKAFPSSIDRAKKMNIWRCLNNFLFDYVLLDIFYCFIIIF